MHKPLPPLLTSLFRAVHVADATRTLLAPLVGHVASQERTIRHQAETIGTLRAQLVAARAQIAVLNAPRSAPEPPEPRLPALQAQAAPGALREPSWCCRRWRTWLAAGIMLAVIGPPPHATPARSRDAIPAPASR